MTENEIGTIVIEAAIAHWVRGCLKRYMKSFWPARSPIADLKVERQVPVPMDYKGIRFDEGFRADVIVEGRLILELKSV